jgi:predicted nucleic-acid-binding protein
MKGVDTNVLVRYLVGDDPIQMRKATHFFSHDCSVSDPCLVNRVVLCELVWVLQRAYGYSRERIAATLEALFQVRQLAIEDPDEARLALEEFRAGGDFADSLIALTNRQLGCEFTVTFDRQASRQPGFRLLQG